MRDPVNEALQVAITATADPIAEVDEVIALLAKAKAAVIQYRNELTADGIAQNKRAIKKATGTLATLNATEKPMLKVRGYVQGAYSTIKG